MAVIKTPESIWNNLGISDPAQADIEVMAFFCGARVEYRQLDGCSARILGLGNRAIITVNKEDSIERQRFSIGHELGHWMKDRGKAFFQCKKGDLSPKRFSNFSTDPEAAANRFAVELLMPQALFSDSAKNRPITMSTARDLQKVFCVSLTAAALRLVQLGSYPSFIACHGKEGYLWSWRHDNIPLSIRVRRLLSKNTAAYRLIFEPGYHEEGPIDVDADDWVEHERASYYVVKEDSVRIGYEKVLTLIWLYDESLITEIN